MSSDYLEYDENLAFQPKMTWEELKDFARKNETYKEYPDGCFFRIGNDLYFGEKGRVETSNYAIAENRSYEQMKAIIENLFDEVK